MAVEEFDVLAPEACTRWAEKVLALRRHWTPRHERLPFFTLGMAAYLDAGSDDAKLGLPPSYHSSILRQHANQLLMEHFGELLEISRVALERRYNCNARYVPSHAALPGFHIHLPHPAFASDVASLHRDLQFMKVFSQTSVQPDQVLTFTLPLSLPPKTGLKTWDGAGSRLHLYQMGFMVAHNGLHPHQAVLHPEPSDMPRIMLQGHGVFQKSELILYW